MSSNNMGTTGIVSYCQNLNITQSVKVLIEVKP